ncbi:unnamed protein product [Owenia fusiformis]|uniref:Uncharacterized protein n=1 Tax=Owenia fusiformis TaxID=6347 RepID=A0A8J1T734_OWEFU|nr:unnamed protein product [Owenia fusiformis]
MATSKLDNDPLMDSVNCSICMETLEDPRCLPCMHSYCRKCIQGIIDAQVKSKTFSCPTCRDRTPIPKEGAGGLKVNFFANSVLEALKDRSMPIDAINCDICSQDDKLVEAVMKCIECNEKLCRTCGRTHQLSRFSKSHKVLQLSGDISKDTTTALGMLSKRTIYCQEHENEPLKYFCKKDKCLICQDCFAFDHQGHPLDNIAQTAKLNIKNLSSVIDLGRQKSDKYEVGITATHIQKQTIEKNIKDAKVQLKADKKLVVANVEAHFEALNDKVAEIGNAAIKNTVARLADLQFQKDAIDGTVKQLENLRIHGHPADIVYNIPEMNAKRETWTQSPDLPIDTVTKIEVQPSKISNNKTIKLSQVKTKREQLAKISVEQHIQIQKEHKIMNVGFTDMRVFPNNVIGIRTNDKLVCYDKDKDWTITREYTLKEKDVLAYTPTHNNGIIVCTDSDSIFYKKMKTYAGTDDVMETIIPDIGSSIQDIAMNKQCDVFILYSDGSILHTEFSEIIIPQFKINNISEANTISMKSNNDIIVAGKGKVIGIRMQSSGSIFECSSQMLEYKPINSKDDALHACVDNKDNIMVLNRTKNTVTLLEPDGLMVKDLIEPGTTNCKMFNIATTGKGELMIAAKHNGSDNENCILTLKYRSDDGHIL